MEIEITCRDLQEVDLERLGWSGGPAHLVALREALTLAWEGVVDLLVAELRTGQLVACGAVDFRKDPAELWMLSVHEAWQGIGVGTLLIGELEARIRQRGAQTAALTVEHDNPRAAGLYRRLGYLETGSQLEGWPTDSGEWYATVCSVMRKSLA